jgi:hypothetical protein
MLFEKRLHRLSLEKNLSFGGYAPGSRCILPAGESIFLAPGRLCHSLTGIAQNDQPGQINDSASRSGGLKPPTQKNRRLKITAP